MVDLMLYKLQHNFLDVWRFLGAQKNKQRVLYN